VATTTDSADASSNAFVTVPGDKHSEVGRTLAEPVPQSLGLFDQFGLWGNLGASLLGFTGAIFVLQPGGTGTPELSLLAALAAIVVGTLLGAVVLGTALVSLTCMRLVRRELRPLKALAERTAAITPDRIHQPIDADAFAQELRPWITQFNALLMLVQRAYVQL